MKLVGIDPGITGALAYFEDGRLLNVVDMPVFDGRADGREISDLMSIWDPDVVYLEWTQPMPKNGSIASYSLGLNSGIVIGVVQALHLSLERVRPQAWKKAMGLLRKPKAASRGMATELFPHMADQFRRVKDDGRAEAALIARFGAYQNIRSANTVTGVDDDGVMGSVSDLWGSRERHPSSANGAPGVDATQGVEP